MVLIFFFFFDFKKSTFYFRLPIHNLATWCGPCKQISPAILELSNSALDVLFLKVDVDENDTIASEYEISAMPTFAFVRNKKLVESFSGAKIEKVKELVTKHKA